MKTKPQQIAGSISDYRRYIKDLVREYLYAKMVAWSIAHLIEPGFKMEVSNYVRIIPYNPKFTPNVNAWDRQVERLAKWYRTEPSKEITQERMEARFWNSTYKYNKVGKQYWKAYIGVVVTTQNSEACEVVIEKVEVEKTRLTGYCAALSEKKYLSTIEMPY